MRTDFKHNGINFSVVVAPSGLQRTEPVVAADKTLLSPQQRKNIGLATYEEEQDYAAKQRKARKRAWNRNGK